MFATDADVGAGCVIDAGTFNSIRRIVYAKSGIAVVDGKEAMVSARVGKRMRSLGISSFKAYLRYLKEDRAGDEVIELLDVISTNVTSFFRQPEQFDFLAETISKWREQKQRRFRFWCAACSTGEEPYSLAITFLEAVGGSWADVKILGTDIAGSVLDTSLRGIYSEAKLDPVPLEQRAKYFKPVGGEDGGEFQARSMLRQMLVFRQLNLAGTPYPLKGPLDAILCRNVMIYFDNDVRRRLLAEMHRLLKPGGYLLTGHAESLTCMLSDFSIVRPSVYVKD